MPAHCCCYGCNSRQEKGSTLKFFRIPKDQKLQALWVSAIKRENWAPTDHTRICCKHFIKGCPSRDPTDPDYIPSLFSHTPAFKKEQLTLSAKVDRHQRLILRTENSNRREAARALIDLFNYKENEVPGISTQTETKQYCDTETQTDIDKVLLNNILCTNRQLKTLYENANSKCKHLQKQLESANTDIKLLKEKCEELEKKVLVLEEENKLMKEDLTKRVLSFSNLDGDDKKIKFYTGLPNCATFISVLETTNTKSKKKSKLSQYDELLLTLIRIRRNLSVSDLAYRFGISAPHVTRTFHRWLNILYKTFGGLVMWPETDVMELPEVFQNETFKKVRCVIDCSEIFIERPTALKARAQTYSNYKRHNTVKFLVGVSPTGGIIFLSKCWGGRASDKQITMESGFIDKLLPGDVVLADRGFPMTEEFAFKGAKLVFPSFTKGRTQLSAKEVEESRRMSRARIHVERVIGRMKDFEILKGTLPIVISNNLPQNLVVRVFSPEFRTTTSQNQFSLSLTL